MTTLLQDIRYGVRQLSKSPVFTLIAIITLAVGIGANTAVFTLTHAVLLRALPVVKPEQLYRVGDQPMCCLAKGLQGNWGLFSHPLYRHFRDHTIGVADLAAFQAGETDLSVQANASEAAEHSRGEFVSGNYFQMFGVLPIAGRNITPEDDAPKAPFVVVMSYRFWQQHYVHDRSIIGSSIRINRAPATIIGVTPQGFYGDTLKEDPPDFWMPLAMEPAVRPQNSMLNQPALHWLYVIARLQPKTQPTLVAAQITFELQQWISNEKPLSDTEGKIISKQRISLAPAAQGVVGRLRSTYSRGLILLTWISAILLLVSCTNITTMFLIRGKALRHQLSICLALGASRERLFRQVLVQSVAISLVGGITSVALAYIGTRMLLALAFANRGYIPISPSPPWPVLGFSLIVSVLTGIVVACVPAWAVSHCDPVQGLRNGRADSVRKSISVQKLIVALQTTFAFALLVVAGLLAHSLKNLTNEQFGFESRGRWCVEFDPELAGYNPESLPTLYEEIQRKLAQIPGVKQVSISRYVPMTGWQWSSEVYVNDDAAHASSENTSASWNRVSPEYFSTLGTALLLGRPITDQDTPTSHHVAVVNQAFVTTFFEPGVNPIGKHFGVGSIENSNSYEIVGVVENAMYSPRDSVGPMFFLPFLQLNQYRDEELTKLDLRSNYARYIELNVTGDISSLGNAVRHILAEIDPNLSVSAVQTFAEQISHSLNEQHLLARLATLISALALTIASLGIYGITSYATERRKNEIGIRMALGATRGGVILLVVRDAMIQTVLGSCIGTLLALVTTRLLSSELYGIEGDDPFTYVAAAAVLTTCGVLAVVLPARRAAKVDPVVSIRCE